LKPAWAKFVRPYLKKKKIQYKKGLVKWLKVKVLSSNPSIGKKKYSGASREKCF
jgi:hypothetical protein